MCTCNRRSRKLLYTISITVICSEFNLAGTVAVSKNKQHFNKDIVKIFLTTENV